MWGTKKLNKMFDINLLRQLIEVQDELKQMIVQLQEAKEKPVIYDFYELEDILKVSRRTLHSYKAQGILPHSQIGHKIFVSQNQLEQFLAEHEVKPYKVRRS